MTRRRTADLTSTQAGFLLSILISMFIAIPSRGQEPLPQGDYSPNEQKSSTETLLDRTDLGNVAQAARMQYDSGVRDLSKAKKLADKASQIAEPKERAKAEKKTLAALERADKAFREAISYNANYFAAYAGLGTALLLQGKANEALQVHALALRRNPDDLENFQGWSASLMALNMLGNATTAYKDYSQSNPARAEILMAEIKEWLASKEANPGDLDPADLQRLAEWVAQQSQG